MHTLLSVYDSRGGAEPLAGLAGRWREPGAEVRVCAPPGCALRLAGVRALAQAVSATSDRS